jgi:hypothetical protein
LKESPSCTLSAVVATKRVGRKQDTKKAKWLLKKHLAPRPVGCGERAPSGCSLGHIDERPSP